VFPPLGIITICEPLIMVLALGFLILPLIVAHSSNLAVAIVTSLGTSNVILEAVLTSQHLMRVFIVVFFDLFFIA